MLYLSMLFFAAALTTGLMGFGGTAMVGMAQLAFFVCLFLSVICAALLLSRDR